MKKRSTPGHIIVINRYRNCKRCDIKRIDNNWLIYFSVVGHNATLATGPVCIYSASKYAVTGMTESLRIELAIEKLKIKVTSVSPGLVATDMPLQAGLPKETLQSTVCLQPKDVSDAVMYALATPPNVQVHQLTITALDK